MRILGFVCVFVAVPLVAWAGAQVRFVVGDPVMEMGQLGSVSVMVVDGTPEGVPDLEVPPGLDVRYVSQSRMTSVVNFHTSHQVQFVFQVTPLVEGVHRLGPAIVKVDGTEMSAEPVTIRVEERPPPESQPIVATAGPSVERAWEGQVVTYRYSVRSKVRVARVNWTQLPVDGLVQPRDGRPVRREDRVSTEEGTVLIDETLEPFIVTGGESIDLPGAVARVDVPVGSSNPFFDGFLLGRTETRTFVTDPSHIEVRPLPPAPPGFTGLVGDFEVEGRLDQVNAKVGDSVRWTVELRGDGTLEGFRLPATDALEGARMYGEAPEVGASVDGRGYRAEGRFERVVVPTRTGTLELPAMEIVVFSPTKGEYVTHRVEVDPIHVLEGGETDAILERYGAGEEAVAEGTMVDPEGMRPIRRRGMAHVWPLGALLPWGALWIVAVGAAGPVTRVSRRAWDRWRTGRSERRAGSSERMARLPRDSEGRLAALHRVFEEVVEQASGRTTPEQEAEVRALRRALERARFGGEEVEPELESRVSALVSALEATS